MHDKTWDEYLTLLLMDSVLMLIKIINDDTILPIEAKIYFSWYVSMNGEKFLDILDDGAFGSIRSLNLGTWDFNKICQFLKFIDVCGETHTNTMIGAKNPSLCEKPTCSQSGSA